MVIRRPSAPPSVPPRRAIGRLPWQQGGAVLVFDAWRAVTNGGAVARAVQTDTKASQSGYTRSTGGSSPESRVSGTTQMEMLRRMLDAGER